MIKFVVIVLQLLVEGYTLGNSTFKLRCNGFDKVVDSATFVDKSSLIKEFFKYEFIAITAPRRFGKSINMDMIKKFCTITVDRKGKRKLVNETDNYSIFSNNKLNIYQDRLFFDNHFGMYPVVDLDFNGFHCNNYRTFINSFKRVIRRCYRTHKYLKISNELDDEEKYQFNKFYENIETLQDYQLYNSIETLTSLLYTHFHKRRCIILIDGLDSPIQKALNEPKSGIEKIVNFITIFISTSVKSNNCVEKALINSCLKLSSVLLENANNIVFLPFLTHPGISKFYGLTENEVGSLLVKFDRINKLDQVRLWYNGHKQLNGVGKIFNVYAVIRFLKYSKLQSYWEKGDEYIVESYFRGEIRRKHELLLDDFENKNEGIEIRHRQVFSINHILDLQKLILLTDEISSVAADLYMQYLTENGFFNILNKGPGYATIQIPNLEIKSEIEQLCSSEVFYKRKYGTAYKHLVELPRRFSQLNNTNETYIELFFCLQSLHKGSEPQSEQSLQRDIFSFFGQSEIFKIVDRQTNVGNDRLSMLLITKEKRGIVIGLKIQGESSLEVLEQLIEQNDYGMLDDKNMSMKIYIGLHLINETDCTMSYLVDSTNVDNSITLPLNSTTRRRYTRRKFTHKKSIEERRKRKESIRRKYVRGVVRIDRIVQ